EDYPQYHCVVHISWFVRIHKFRNINIEKHRNQHEAVDYPCKPQCSVDRERNRGHRSSSKLAAILRPTPKHCKPSTHTSMLIKKQKRAAGLPPTAPPKPVI